MSPSITLAGVTYPLPEKALLGEIRAISVLWSQKMPPLGPELEGMLWDQAVDIIIVAMRRPQPDWTRESIYEQPIEASELWAARRTIVTHVGLMKELKPGEDLAGAGQAGNGSTANSALA